MITIDLSPGKLYEAVDECLAVIAECDYIENHGGHLFHIWKIPGDREAFEPVNEDWLRGELSRRIVFTRGGTVTDPPVRLVKTVLASRDRYRNPRLRAFSCSRGTRRNADDHLSTADWVTATECKSATVSA